jgi:ribosomal protein S18 acetylase RimI-like enzyme
LDYEIVPITEDLIQGYHACLDIVARERRYLALLQAPPLESSQSWVRANLEKDAPAFVAVSGGEVVGWCDIRLDERPGSTHRGELGMGVHPDYRSQGIGSALLTAALESARRIGLEQVELDVFASNAQAIRLYERFGFEVEGRKRRARKLDGMCDDSVQMVLSRISQMSLS